MTNPNQKTVSKPPHAPAFGTHAAEDEGISRKPTNEKDAKKASPHDPNQPIPVEHLDDAENPGDIAPDGDLYSATNANPPHNPRGGVTEGGKMTEIVPPPYKPGMIEPNKPIAPGAPSAAPGVEIKEGAKIAADQKKIDDVAKKPGSFTAGSDKKDDKK